MKEVAKTHIAKKFRSNSVGNTVHYLRSVICRIDVEAEWTLSKRCVNNPNDRIRNLRGQSWPE